MPGNRFSAAFLDKCIFYTIHEAHKQYSLSDTVSNHIFYLGPPGKYMYIYIYILSQQSTLTEKVL